MRKDCTRLGDPPVDRITASKKKQYRAYGFARQSIDGNAEKYRIISQKRPPNNFPSLSNALFLNREPIVWKATRATLALH